MSSTSPSTASTSSVTTSRESAAAPLVGLPWAASSAAVSDDGGVAGGPGPGFHFPDGVAPGASFCNDQARSPGVHV